MVIGFPWILFFNRLEKKVPFKKQLRVRLSSDQDLPQVEFRSTPEPAGNILMSRLHLPTRKFHSTVSPGPIILQIRADVLGNVLTNHNITLEQRMTDFSGIHYLSKKASFKKVKNFSQKGHVAAQ